MAASSVEEFDDHLNSVDCDSHVRTIVSTLRRHINAWGPVTWLAHKSTASWGIRASVAGRIVCRMDPKPVGGYVAVQVMDAQPADLAAAGGVYLRKDAPPWVHVAVPDAVAVLLPLIDRACATAKGRTPATGRATTR
jgi:hypothetical protein